MVIYFELLNSSPAFVEALRTGTVANWWHLRLLQSSCPMLAGLRLLEFGVFGLYAETNEL